MERENRTTRFLAKKLLHTATIGIILNWTTNNDKFIKN